MARYSIKDALERSARFNKSWQENSPAKEWSGMTLAQSKTADQALNDKAAEIAQSEAHTKTLKIEFGEMLDARMTDCDYIAAAVEGDRQYGADSALYGGFGYIRKSEKKKGGRRKAPTV